MIKNLDLKPVLCLQGARIGKRAFHTLSAMLVHCCSNEDQVVHSLTSGTHDRNWVEHTA